MQMSSLFKKLNLGDKTEILVLDPPESFESELSLLQDVSICRELKAIKRVSFVLAFATRQREVNAAAKMAARKTQGDAVVWIAYPKGTSRNYRCEFNRDTGWDEFGKAGFEPVRQVAIDQDWSALRFRRVEFIKSMTRDKTRRLTVARRRGAAKP
jgi:hypothetical protein